MADLMGGSKTDKNTIHACEGWAKSFNCVPLMVNKEILGFCFNRVWRAIKKECLHMWGKAT